MASLKAESSDKPLSFPSVVFHAEGLTKTYQMGEVQVHALRGIDLDLHESEFIVLLGASGSGKSTLLISWEVWMCPPAEPYATKTMI